MSSWYNYSQCYGKLSKNRIAPSPLPTHTQHPAGTSIISDICDLSKISDIAPLTLGSMEKVFFTTYFVSHRKPI